jgi:chromosome segregation ATPase
MEASCNPLMCFDVGFVRRSTYQIAKSELSEEQKDHAITKAKLEDMTIQLQAAKNACEKVKNELCEESSRYQSQAEAHEQTKSELESTIEIEVDEHADTKTELQSTIDRLVQAVSDAEKAMEKEKKAREQAEATIIQERVKIDLLQRLHSHLETESEQFANDLKTKLDQETQSKDRVTKTLRKANLSYSVLQRDTAEASEISKQKIQALRKKSRKAEEEYERLERKYEWLQAHPPKMQSIDTSTWEGFLDGLRAMEKISSSMRANWPYHSWAWGTKGTTKARLVSLRSMLKMYP